MSELTLKELLKQAEATGDISGSLFSALLKIEMESAEFAVDYIMGRFVKHRTTYSKAPDYMIEDLASALNVYAAFNVLLDYYSVPGEVE